MRDIHLKLYKIVSQIRASVYDQVYSDLLRDTPRRRVDRYTSVMARSTRDTFDLLLIDLNKKYNDNKN